MLYSPMFLSDNPFRRGYLFFEPPPSEPRKNITRVLVDAVEKGRA